MFGKFQAGLIKDFAESPLPPAVIGLSAYAIVGAESLIGALLIVGIWQRATLVAGSLLMWMLLFGVCLIQNWTAAGAQLTYLAFFTVLLATLSHGRYSLDGLLNWRRG